MRQQLAALSAVSDTVLESRASGVSPRLPPCRRSGTEQFSGSGAASVAAARVAWAVQANNLGAGAVATTAQVSGSGGETFSGTAAVAGTGTVSASGTELFSGAAALSALCSAAGNGQEIFSGTIHVAAIAAAAAVGAYIPAASLLAACQVVSF